MKEKKKGIADSTAIFYTQPRLSFYGASPGDQFRNAWLHGNARPFFVRDAEIWGKEIFLFARRKAFKLKRFPNGLFPFRVLMSFMPSC